MIGFAKFAQKAKIIFLFNIWRTANNPKVLRNTKDCVKSNAEPTEHTFRLLVHIF